MPLVSADVGRLHEDMGKLVLTQAFTSDNTPKGNADRDRLMRTLKKELS